MIATLDHMHTDLGQTNSIDVINDLTTLAGQSVIDVGCGDMTFARQLAEHGARVLAIDPDPDQAQRNGAADSIEGVTFQQAGAESLPAEPASLDGVYFSFSLHHVPESLYPQVFTEVARVLKPDGYLCVIEPTGSPLNDVMRLFHDEEAVRDAAQAALTERAMQMFRTHQAFRYHSFIEYESFKDYADRATARTFNTGYSNADVRRPEVEAAFEAAGAPDYRFMSPKLMMFLQGLSA